MATGARTNAAALLSGPSGAAGGAMMRRGAQTSRRISKAGDAQICTRFVVFSGRDGRATLRHAPSKPRGLDWEATVSVPGVWIGAYFVELLFCWATDSVGKV